jgi:3D (Asp-Asp-Asp) domain-containing protein
MAISGPHATKERHRVVGRKKGAGRHSAHLVQSGKAAVPKRAHCKPRHRGLAGAHFKNKPQSAGLATASGQKAVVRAVPRYGLAALALPLAVATVASGQMGKPSRPSAGGGRHAGAAATEELPAGWAVASGLPLPGGALALVPSLAAPPPPRWKSRPLAVPGRPLAVPGRPLAVPSLGSPPKARWGGGLGRRPHQHLPRSEERPSRNFLGVFLVTCYDLTGPTATGAMAGPESVAVDPNVVPLGTHIYIDGVGPRIADDTGGAIVGQRLDIWEPSYSACTDWGAEERAVYRLVPPA